MSSPFRGVKAKKPLTKKTATKEASVSSLIKLADEVFSKHIRKRHAVNGVVKCFTCDALMRIAVADCGHYIPRSVYALRYDGINCQVQCFNCNRELYGNLDIFRERLMERFGIVAVENLEAQRHSLTKLDKFELLEIIQKYS